MAKHDDETPLEALGDRPEVEPDAPEPVATTDTSTFVPLVEGRPQHAPDADPTRQVVGPHGEGAALREPVEKGNQEGRIGVVDRVLTPLGEEIGIEHGVVSHELEVQPTADPYERCPNCGNVNLAYHNKARTSAHCPSCLWQSGNLNAQPNPPDRVPGMHETPGAKVDAGEIPKGKLEGALGMDPQEAKEGVPVDVPHPKEVTSFHLDAEGEPIKSTEDWFVRRAEDPAEARPGTMPGNVTP